MHHSRSQIVTLTILLSIVLFGWLARPALAQAAEVGGGVGYGCTGDSSGFCGDNTGPMWALEAGFWVSRRVQIAARLATLPLADFTLTAMHLRTFMSWPSSPGSSCRAAHPARRPSGAAGHPASQLIAYVLAAENMEHARDTIDAALRLDLRRGVILRQDIRNLYSRQCPE